MKYELRLNGQPNESSRQLECILWWNEAVKCQDSNCKKHFKQANWLLLVERLWLHAIRLWFARKSLVRFLFELITNRWATFQLSIACDCNCSSSKWSFEIFFRGLNPPTRGTTGTKVHHNLSIFKISYNTLWLICPFMSYRCLLFFIGGIGSDSLSGSSCPPWPLWKYLIETALNWFNSTLRIKTNVSWINPNWNNRSKYKFSFMNQLTNNPNWGAALQEFVQRGDEGNVEFGYAWIAGDAQNDFFLIEWLIQRFAQCTNSSWYTVNINKFDIHHSTNIVKIVSFTENHSEIFWMNVNAVTPKWNWLLSGFTLKLHYKNCLANHHINLRNNATKLNRSTKKKLDSFNDIHNNDFV